MSGVEVIRAASLDGIPHGFLGREGGVSTGAYAGLKVGLGSDDDRDAVHENRRRAVAAVAPGAALVTVHQMHTPDALYAAAPWPDGERPYADAIVTDRPGLVLGILTADCTPVLLADGEAGVIGAAHAGWKGAFAGVIESVVAAMARRGARRERIAAAIGPVIARKSYEAEADPANERFFTPGREGHHQFDIEAYVLARLAEAGVTRAEALGLDTYADPDRFFSYRRATHRGEPGYGRQISLIALPENSDSHSFRNP
jgi:YfiH family protein